MRTFIAVKFSKEAEEFLSGLVEKLKKTDADVKWVSPQNIHLTLKFLGETDDQNIDSIIKAMGDTAADNAVFPASLSGLGAFPSLESPRVIWVGIDRGDKEFKVMVKDLQTRLAGLGFMAEDRGFSSHITIGRTRSSRNSNGLKKKITELQVAAKENQIESVIDRITLFKSTLTPKGPIYEAIKEVNLPKISL